MTIIKQGNGVLTRYRVMLIGFSSSSYKKIHKDDIFIKGNNYYRLGADIDIFNKVVKRR